MNYYTLALKEGVYCFTRVRPSFRNTFVLPISQLSCNIAFWNFYHCFWWTCEIVGYVFRSIDHLLHVCKELKIIRWHIYKDFEKFFSATINHSFLIFAASFILVCCIEGSVLRSMWHILPVCRGNEISERSCPKLIFLTFFSATVTHSFFLLCVKLHIGML